MVSRSLRKSQRSRQYPNRRLLLSRLQSQKVPQHGDVRHAQLRRSVIVRERTENCLRNQDEPCERGRQSVTRCAAVSQAQKDTGPEQCTMLYSREINAIVQQSQDSREGTWLMSTRAQKVSMPIITCKLPKKSVSTARRNSDQVA